MSVPERPGAAVAVRDELRALAREPVAVPAGLTSEVMRRVRAGAPSRGSLTLPGVRGGTTTVAGRVVTRVATVAARRVDGVAYASARLDEDGALLLRLVAELGPDLQRVAADVREAVRAEATALCGLDPTRIDVRVDDVTD